MLGIQDYWMAGLALALNLLAATCYVDAAGDAATCGGRP